MSDPALPPGASDGAATSAEAIALLRSLDARLARIEARLSRVESGGLAAVAVATDTLDGWALAAQSRGVDPGARVATALKLLERLTAPDTAAALTRGLDLAEALPGQLATAVNVLDGVATRALAEGIDPADRFARLTRALERLTSPEALDLLSLLLGRIDQLRGVLEGGALAVDATRVISLAGGALAATAAEPPAHAGALHALRALGDAEVKTALGFGVRFAKHFGRALAGIARPALGAGDTQEHRR